VPSGSDLCKYCGAGPVAKLKKGHIQKWMEGHPRRIAFRTEVYEEHRPWRNPSVVNEAATLCGE